MLAALTTVLAFASLAVAAPTATAEPGVQPAGAVAPPDGPAQAWLLADLDSGRILASHDPYGQHAPASTIKVPVILYLNSLAAQGKIDWQAKIAYNKKTDWQDGAGLLQFAARDGDTYSLRVLANLAVTTSDNIAYRMLRRYLGMDNIISFMKGLGGNTVWPNGDNISTARDMATYMTATLNFQRDYPELGRRLLDDMANAIYDVGLPGKLPDAVTVAHKEGDVSGVQNDVGIVFGSRPYVLTIMSQGNDDPDKGFGYIAEISRIVYDYQEWVAKWA
jgi:beta-lactamase class A